MIRNLTPHKINLVSDNGRLIESFEPENVSIRLIEEIVDEFVIECLPIVRKAYTSIDGLPEQNETDLLMVSNIVLQASSRADLIAPDTGPDSALRNENGQIIGVKRFQVGKENA